jgi:hypothetical protein
MLNRLHRRVEITGFNEDGLWFACNEIEEPLLQRLKVYKFELTYFYEIYKRKIVNQGEKGLIK